MEDIRWKALGGRHSVEDILTKALDGRHSMEGIRKALIEIVAILSRSGLFFGLNFLREDV